MDEIAYLDGHLGRGWLARHFELDDDRTVAHTPETISLRGVCSVDLDGVEELITLVCATERAGRPLQLQDVPTSIAEDLLRFGFGDLLEVRHARRRRHLRLVR